MLGDRIPLKKNTKISVGKYVIRHSKLPYVVNKTEKAGNEFCLYLFIFFLYLCVIFFLYLCVHASFLVFLNVCKS